MENFHWGEYWDAIKSSLQNTYGFLEEEDLYYKGGRETIILKNLEAKLGISRLALNDLLFLHLICAGNEEAGAASDPIHNNKKKPALQYLEKAGMLTK
jgi:hypothetical protein